MPKKKTTAAARKRRRGADDEAEAAPAPAVDTVEQVEAAMPPLPGILPDPAPHDGEEVSVEAIAEAVAIADAAAGAVAAIEAGMAATAEEGEAGTAGGEGQQEPPASKRSRTASAATAAAVGSTKRTENWNARFEELRAFHAEKGHFHLPKKDTLSQWARDQRTQYAKAERGAQSTLTPERREALDSIGFPWRLWTKKTWEERLSDLQAFKDEHGNCDVPIRRDEPQSLATWVDEQRKLYRNKQKGKKNALSDEREAKLEEMGFSWYRYGPTSWSDRINELKAYKEEHGDCVVPLRLKNEKDNPWKRLANWVSFQRLQYKKRKQGKKSLLSDDRLRELEEIGFVFSVKEDNPNSTWNVMLDELYRYKSQFDTCNVPARYEANKRLAAWVRYIRHLHAKMEAGDQVALTKGRIKVLEGMGFEWVVEEEADAVPVDDDDYFAAFAQEEAAEAAAPKYTGKTAAGFARNENAWNMRLDELNRYKAEHGHTNVAWKGKNQASDPNLAMLGKWVSKQRSEYRKLSSGKKSQITTERVQALDAIGFDWSPGSAMVDWSVRLDQLKAYQEEHGHTNVPKSYQPNPSLGQWVQTQRVYYKRLKAGKPTHMTNERRQQLDDIGFQWHVGTGRKGNAEPDQAQPMEVEADPKKEPAPSLDDADANDDPVVADDAVAAAAAAASEALADAAAAAAAAAGTVSV